MSLLKIKIEEDTKSGSNHVRIVFSNDIPEIEDLSRELLEIEILQGSVSRGSTTTHIDMVNIDPEKIKMLRLAVVEMWRKREGGNHNN